MKPTDYRVMMFLDGIEVPSSCVKTGSFRSCEESAKRLTRNADPRITWRVLPCMSEHGLPVAA